MDVVKALTADDFRRMIGTSDYGEVRLSTNGGLEKVNNHFLQRHNVKAVKISPQESSYLANSLVAALSRNGIDGDTLRAIREKLDLSLGATVAQPLSTRVIREVFDLVDGKESLPRARLKSAIDDFNNRVPREDSIRLSNNQMTVLTRRYGKMLAAEEKKGCDLGQMIKNICSTDDLLAGTRSLGLSGVKSRDGEKAEELSKVVDRVAFAATTWSTATALEYLGMKPGEKFNQLIQAEYDSKDLNLKADKREQLNLERAEFIITDPPIRKEDCNPVDFFKKFGAARHFDKLDVGKLRPSDLFENNLFKTMIHDTAGDLARNTMRACVTGPSGVKEPLVSFTDPGDIDRATKKNEGGLEEFAKNLLRMSPRMTTHQLCVTLQVLGQESFRFLGNFGIPPIDSIRKYAQISFDGDDVKISFHFTSNNKDGAQPYQYDDKGRVCNPPPFKWEYCIKPDGMGQTEYLGLDKDPPEIPELSNQVGGPQSEKI